MRFFSLRKWLTRKPRTSRSMASSRCRTSFRKLELEHLETRLAPATDIWNGGGAPNFNWSNAANWSNGRPNPGDDLVFPAGVPAASLVNTNDLSVGTAYNSISFSGSNYNLKGNAITLGGMALTGNVVANGSTTGNIITLDVTLGGTAGNRQFFTVNANADLTVVGHIGGTTGVELTKSGAGQLNFRNDNSAFTGPITVDQGILQISNPRALGDTSNATTVLTNAQLQVSSGTGTVNENVIINGPGVKNDGALLNVAGSNMWAGMVTLDSDASLGASAGALNITGQVNDLGAGHNLTKEGPGQVIFSAANSYRGTTTINNGILTIRNGLGLGAAGTPQNGTFVNSTASQSGTLQLEDPTGVGFTVANELLVLNGAGFGGIGALDNVNGDNLWTANVTLGSPAPVGKDVSIGAEVQGTTVTSVNILGVVGDPVSGPLNLTKVGPGRVIFSNSDTYRGQTTIAAGFLQIRDSQGLGPAGTAGTTSVADGATLELAVDNLPDSVTGTTNTLRVNEPLTILGRGAGGVGALRNVSGINVYAANITLATPPPTNPPPQGSLVFDAIGVEPDPNAHADNSYFTNDWSLTTTGVISDGPPPTPSTTVVIPWPVTFTKVGTGQLILPVANTYTGPTNIEQGWVTIQDNHALGGRKLVAPPNPPQFPGTQIGDTAQPATHVFSGAALHLKPKTATDHIDLVENLILSGNGITHPFGLINQKGALMSLGGLNTVGGLPTGDSSDIQLDGQTGIGSEQLAPATNGELTVTAGIADYVPMSGFSLNFSGGPQENAALIDTGSNAGTIILTYDTFTIPDQVRVYYPPRGQPGSTRIYDSGFVGTMGPVTVTLNYGPGTSNFVEIVVNEGGNPNQGTAWQYSVIIVGNNHQGGITKLGSKRLNLQGPGTYSNVNDVKEGVLRVQNDTALGKPSSGTTVENGAALELAGSAASVNGGIAAGVEVWGESLTLNGPGNTSTTGSLIATLTNVNNDNLWRGPVTLATGVNVDVAANSRLSLSGSVDDTINPAPAGSDITKTGPGKLVLAGANSYRGTTFVNAGILNVQNSQALGAITGGTIVANNASLELQGDITIGGESLTLQGQGVPVAAGVPLRWFAQGPAPILTGQTPGNGNVTGRITGIAVDPSDLNVIYVSAAGGGAWKTEDGGVTWQPLFDSQLNSTLFSGAIAISPTDPRIVYLATGEANNSADSFYGTGVYKSTDSGKSWTLLTGPGGSNPLNGRAVSKIIVDPNNANRIYAAVSDLAANGQLGNPGVWRYDGSIPTPNWFNLTNVVSSARLNTPNTTPPAPQTPGPDDDFRIRFPQAGAAWSDLFLAPSGTLYAALGSPNGYGVPNPLPAGGTPMNAVYRCPNPTTAAPVWFIGNGTVNGQNGFPTGFSSAGRRGGRIAIGVSGNTIYAASQDATQTIPPFGMLLDIQKSTDGGQTWNATTKPANYMGQQGWFDNAVIVDPTNPNVVDVAGVDQLRSTDGGQNWTNISTDINGNGPHVNCVSLSLDATNRVYAATGGGIWRLDLDNNRNPVWTDLNGNLPVTQFHGVDIDPFDPNVAFGGIEENGTNKFVGSPGWDHVDDGNGGLVRIDPLNPSIVFHVVNGQLARSTTGGTPGSFNTVFDVDGGAGAVIYFPFLIDQINNNRLLLGGPLGAVNAGVFESISGGLPNTWVNLGLNGGASAVAAASFQGTFVADPGFPTVGDKGANNYDPDTIYVIRQVANPITGVIDLNVSVTKDHGASWLNRSAGLPTTGLADIAVDPRNRDTAYVVRNVFGGGKVFRTTDGGQTWADITGTGVSALPDVPVWKVVVDPRNGNIYLGTDRGVYVSTTGGNSWQVLGAGMPITQATDMVLNLSRNVLAVGSYGRSMFFLSLDDSQANAGALRGLSGASVWTGPVILAGPTTIAAGGTQAIVNGRANAQLTIVGVISDQTPGANFTLTKMGGGSVVLSGTNTYGGVTLIKQGVLSVRNPQALGDPGNGTFVDPSDPANFPAALELQSSVSLEPLFLKYDGVPFNGHNTGALRNVSNNNTYSGPITLQTNVTIGVDSGSQLTVTGVIDDGANTFTLTKELPGTLVLAHANTYDGTTFVNQGALRVMDPQGLGSTAGDTRVFDGAQLQLQGGVTVSGESLLLSGTGVFGTGALLNTGGNNTWRGPITLTLLPGFSPETAPAGAVALGSSVAGDVLTIDTAISETIPTGIVKVGPGKIVLPQSNTYSGTTYVNAGILAIQTPTALGTTNTLEIQRVTVGGATFGSFTLSFKGQTTGQLAFNATAGQVQTALNNLSTIGGVGGSVTVTRIGNAFTVTFGGSLAGVDQPLLGATGIGGSTVVVSAVAEGGTGTLVNSGGTLQLDLDPLNGGLPSTVSGETLQLNGAGFGAIGALNNRTGTNTWAAAIALNSSSSIGVDAGTLTATGGISGPPAAALTKVGVGTLFLPTTNNTYQGQTFVQAGTLEVDGSIASSASVQMTGGTLAGIGTVGPINSPIPGGGGTVAPGTGPGTVGTLHSGAVTWTSAISFSVDLNGTGGNNDVLQVTGTVNLGGAQLTGTLGYAAAIGDTFTILQATGNITGNFASGASVFIGGRKFSITIDNSGATKTITLKRIAANTITTITSAVPNPSTFGDQVTFTATVTPEAGATGVPTGSVTFKEGSTTLGTATLNNIGGVATAVFTTGPVQLTGGTHIIFAVYSSDIDFNASTSPNVTQTVLQHATTTTITSHVPNPSVFGDMVTFTATVSPTIAGVLPTGTVDFKEGTTVLGSGTLSNMGGVATATFTTSATQLRGGAHTVFAVYNSDINFAGSTSSSVTQTVVQHSTTTTLTSPGPNPSTFGDPISFTATVTPAVGGVQPTGSVDFKDGSTLLATVPLAVVGGVATASYTPTVAQLTGGTHQIFAVYSSDSNFQGSTSNTINQTVNQHSTTTTISSVTPSPSQFGMQVTFKATVAPTIGTVLPTGRVDFKEGSTVLGTATLTNVSGAAVATFTTSATQLAVGSHTIVAVYNSDQNFAGSTSAAVTHMVTKTTTTTTVTSSFNPSVFGQPVTFTAAVVTSFASPLTPTGSADFSVDGGPATNVPLDNTGHASSSPANPLSAGNHTITVTYQPTGVFLTSTGSLPGGQTVTKAGTTTAVSADINPAVFGQTVTFTATVTQNTPSLVTPTGTADFVIDGTVAATVALVNGRATFQTNTLNVNGSPHTVVVNFKNLDGNFTNSSAGLSGGETITKAGTTTTVTSSVNPSVFGQTVTFTAVVAANMPSLATPTGTVNFVIDGVTVANNVTLVGGQATFQTSTLSVAGSPHVVAVGYTNLDGNFSNSGGTLAGGQTVNKDNTVVTVASSVNPSVFGQPVTFTATVRAAAPGSGTPDGTVVFTIDDTLQSPSIMLDANGQATYTPGSLAVAGSPHKIQATYAGNGSFLPNSGLLPGGQTVNKADTTTTVSSSKPVLVSGESVTFTATITPVLPGAGTVTGTVTFVIDGTPQAPATVTNGRATITTTLTAVGSPHTVVANYSGDASFKPSAATLSPIPTVAKDDTTTAVTSSANPSLFSQPVTFTATVTAKAPGSGTPTGNVTFFIDGARQTPDVPLNNNGQATLTTSSLSVGTHTVTANYLGDGNFNTSSGSLTQVETVSKADSNVTVTSSVNPSVFGQSVTFTAVVAATSPSVGTPTGTVNFLVDGVVQAAGVNLVGGRATFTTAALAASVTHTIQVTYGGNGNFNGSSGTLPGGQVVNRASVTATVTSDNNPSVFGQPVRFTATVTPVPPGAGLPTGTVTFLVDGTAVSGVISLGAGQASFTTQAIPVTGSPHRVQVQYSGDPSFAPVTSAAISQVVTKANTTITVTSPKLTPPAGKPLTFTAAVGAGVGAPTPTGSVVFTFDSTVLPPTPLDANGRATFTASAAAMTVGNHLVSATYLGSGDYNGSGLTIVQQVFTPNQSYVAQLYRDLLRREVDPTGLRNWSAQLDAGAARQVVVNGITGSQEYQILEINDLYLAYFNRVADPQGLNNWLRVLANPAAFAPGQNPLDFIKAQMLGSVEFFNGHGGGSNPSFLNALYLAVLNRPVDSSGVQSFLPFLNAGGSRVSVAQAVLGSVEAQQVTVQSFYNRFLHRSADPNGLAGWVNLLLARKDQNLVIAGIAGSDEYFGNL
jgi:large repetitive protein